MAEYILTIGAVERECRLGSLQLTPVLNGVDTMVCHILSLNGAYRPALGAEVRLTEDGSPIFGGLIDRTEETGADGQPLDDIETRISCVGFNVLADRRFVTATFSAGQTLEQVITALHADYLDAYGVTLDASQATGPTLPLLEFDNELLSSVLNKLTTLTDWPWRIDADKEFGMFEPGTVAAPVGIADSDDPAHYFGDIRVTRSRDKYFNRVVVKIGTEIAVEKTETFTGDGSTDTFPLTYQAVYTPSIGRGYIVHDGIFQTLGILEAGSPPVYTATWMYDPFTNSLLYTPAGVLTAVPNSDVVAFTYDAQFPMIVTAEDASEISMNGIYEAAFVYPDVYDATVGTQLAEAILAQSLETQVQIEFDTYEIGLLPGQTMTAVIADRNVNDDFLIVEVRARNPTTSQDVIRSVRAISGLTFRGSFRDTYKAWLGGSVANSATIGPPISSGAVFSEIKVAQITADHTQLSGMGVTPVPIVAAKPGFVLVPIGFMATHDFVSGYSGTNDWRLQYDGDTTNLTEQNSFAAQQTIPYRSYHFMRNTAFDLTLAENKALVVAAGITGGGDASNEAEFSVAYYEHRV